MDQGCLLECYNCRILYPGLAKCGTCGGKGTRFQPAQMADESLSHQILKDGLERLDSDSTIIRLRDSLVRTLTHWQIYGRAYVRVQHGLNPDTPAFDKALNAIRDDLAGRIRKLDQEI